jgi:dihydrofolate synthase/folylpolyglutamate synthase
LAPQIYKMNTYAETLRELYSLQQFAIKMGLENISYLCQLLRNPQNSYPSIHVAGTNGKGSTSVMIQKILTAQGLSVGLYTSPHLVDFRERICVDNQNIDEKFINNFWGRMRSEVVKEKTTFFDITTAMAFKYFEHKRVDVSVVETGLGGRLDSTNILNPCAVVITPIAIDHIKQLGSKIEQIAHEKAAIIKKNSTLFCGKQEKVVENVLDQYQFLLNQSFKISESITLSKIRCNLTDSIFNFYDHLRNESKHNIRLNLAAGFQIDNAMLSYLTSRWYLEGLNLKFKFRELRNTFKKVQWLGRLQRMGTNPNIYFDVSHNYSGFKKTVEFIQQNFAKQSLHLLIGLLADKEYKAIVNLVSKNFTHFVITEPEHERSLPGTVLENEFLNYGINAIFIKDIDEAFEFSKENTPRDHTLLVAGSHFIIGRLLQLTHN